MSRRDLLTISVVAVLLIAVSAPQFYDEYSLSRHAQEIEATVVSKHSGHGWIEYSYVVQGRTYEGRTPSESAGKPFDKVSIGDKLTVRFDPTHPGVSGTPETRDVMESTSRFLLAGFAVFTSFMLLRGMLPK